MNQIHFCTGFNKYCSVYGSIEKRYSANTNNILFEFYTIISIEGADLNEIAKQELKRKEGNDNSGVTYYCINKKEWAMNRMTRRMKAEKKRGKKINLRPFGD